MQRQDNIIHQQELVTTASKLVSLIACVLAYYTKRAGLLGCSPTQNIWFRPALSEMCCKGYQHQGFICFFFFRPIIISYKSNYFKTKTVTSQNSAYSRKWRRAETVTVFTHKSMRDHVLFLPASLFNRVWESFRKFAVFSVSFSTLPGPKENKTHGNMNGFLQNLRKIKSE